MTEIVRCDNHTCTAQFDKAQDEYVSCSLCRQPAYCGDECRLMDWRAHDCPNVHHTESIKSGFAVPYHYEDMLTAEELQDVPLNDPIFQQYQVMHRNTNRTISQYIIPSLVEKNAQSKDDEAPIARGKKPVAITASNYILGITVGGKTYYIDGSITADMIFKENDQNPTAQALSGGGATFKDRVKNVFRGGIHRALHHEETSYIFWPPNQRLRQQFVEVEFSGDITVSLYTKDVTGRQKQVSAVFAGYKLPMPGKSDASAAARKVQQMFRSQIALKFKNSDLSTKNLYVRRYSDFEGNGVVLTFEISTRGKPILVDVEYIVLAERFKSDDVLPATDTLTKTLKETGVEGDKTPPPPAYDESQIVSTRYACDVRSFEEVAGLVMELDTFISVATPPSAGLQDLQNKAAIIKEYAHKMEANGGQAPNSIPPEVDAAVAGALNALYEPIGLNTYKEWERNALAANVDKFVKDVDDIIAQIDAIDAKPGAAAGTVKGTAGRFFRSVRTNILRRNLRTAKKAIDAHAKVLSRTAEWSKLQAVRDKITQYT